MTPAEAIKLLSLLPWQELVPVLVSLLEGIDKAATNQFEKFVLEAAISFLRQIAPPAPPAGS